jgi:ABC-2 type transport system ATP-binding protein
MRSVTPRGPKIDAIAQPALVVEGVRKSYGKKPAVDGVSLRVGAGETVILLGPNGAGKTTLFSMVTGLFYPDAGRIVVNGHDMARQPLRALAGLGVVFQQPTLDLDLTVRQNLEFHMALHGLKDAERMKAELARWDLLDRARDPARKLNGGHRRRLEIARAFLHRPRFLLLDEPTVGLDLASRRGLRERIHALVRDEGVAVLWATHLLEDAEFADRIVLMDRGRIVAEGTEESLSAEAGADTLERAFYALTSAKAEAA